MGARIEIISIFLQCLYFLQKKDIGKDIGTPGSSI